MSAAVIDLLSPEGTTLDVAKAWVDCGLARPLAWARLDPVAQWELLDPSPDRPDDLVEMGEILNYLGGRSGLHVVVLGDPASADDAGRLGQLSSLLDRIARDFGPRRPPTTLLLAIPPMKHAEATSRYPVDLIELQHWDNVLVVAPEDTPAPQFGNELGNRSMDSLMTHCLFGLCNGWRVDATAPPDRRAADEPGEQVGRLIRAWSRVVDAGFVVDQLASEIMRLPAKETTPAVTRVTNTLNSILGSDIVKADLEASPPPPPPVKPKGLRFLLGFFVFAVRNVVPVVAKAVLTRILRPIWALLNRFVRWGLKLIGVREATSLTPLPPLDPPPNPVDPVSKARAVLRELDSGVDLVDAPPANERLLRYITDEVVAAIDARRLSVTEAVGLDSTGVPTTLMGRVVDRYRETLRPAREQVETVAGRLGQQLNVPDANVSPEEVVKSERRERRRRRLRKVFAFLLVLIALAASVVGLVVPGLAALGFVPLVLGVGWVVDLLRRLLLHLGEMYDRQFGTEDSAEYLERLLNYLVGVCIRRTYRIGQLQQWTRVIRAAAEGVAAGAELPSQEQRPFTPVYAPRSMNIATGMTNNSQIAALAARVRTGEDSPLYKPVWSAVLSGRQEAFEEIRRLPRDGAMAELLEMELRGLPGEARTIGRSVVTQALQRVTVDEVLRGVVPWVRQRESHGVERLDTKPGVEPPGPSGRAVDTPSVELGLHSLSDCVVLIGPPSEQAIGFGVVLAGDGRIVVTAKGLINPIAVVAVDGYPVEGDRIDDGELTALRHEAHIDGVALGGLSTMRLGRALLAPASDGQIRVPQRCTITSVDGEGFTVDASLRPGTPLIDAASGVLLGIVVSESPSRAVGPVALQRLMASVSLTESSRHEDELDTGLWIPLDVQLGGSLQGTELTPRDEGRSSPILGSAFLGTIASPSDWFLPLLTDDTAVLEVDKAHDHVAPSDPGLSTLSAWLNGDGRLLLTSHRIQMSKQFKMRNLYPLPHQVEGPASDIRSTGL